MTPGVTPRTFTFACYTGTVQYDRPAGDIAALHWTPEGLAVGVQLVAAYGREDILIRVASQLEQAAPWSERHLPQTPDAGPRHSRADPAEAAQPWLESAPSRD